ncbi:MAG: c-type cytochrome [Bacteroidota bacterium]
MKKKLKAIASYITALGAGMVVTSSCVSDPDSSGLEYMPDMYRSPAVEPYVDYGHIQGKEVEKYKTQQSAMRPPHRTIPYRGTDSLEVAMMLPYHRKASKSANVTHGLFELEGWILSDSTDTEYEKAKADKNPIQLTAENVDAVLGRGEKIYASKCQHCHGEKGEGNGPMVKSGAYAGVPKYKDLTDLGDGQVFYSIYYGKGAMGAHSMILNKKEIWTLVHYVNQFRFDDYGDFSEASDSEEEGADESSEESTEEDVAEEESAEQE